MSEAMTATADDQASERAAAPSRPGLSWRRLQQIAAVVAVLTFVVPMVLAGSFEPFLATMAAPFLVGLLLDAFLPRTGAVFLGVVSLLILGSSAPFLAEALLHPESTLDFVPLVLLVLATLVAIAATVPAYREARGSSERTSLPRTIVVVASLIAVVATAVSLIAAAGTTSVAAQPGDVTVTTRDFAFAPASLTADAGTVAVHMTND